LNPPPGSCARPVRNGAGAPAIRCRYSLILSSCEEVAAVTVKTQKPLFRRRVRFDRAVVQDVADGQATRGELDLCRTD
jgi:hypothetical protein